ncbi:MAG: hypothetical protein ACRCXL_06730 [Dermatophilaceae bacterium]
MRSGDRKVSLVVGAVLVVMVAAIGVLGFIEYRDGQRQERIAAQQRESAESAESAGETASPAPSPSVAVVPAAARSQTVAGAEAFIRFYLDEVDRALTEPAAGLLPGLSDSAASTARESKRLPLTS